MAFSSSFRFLQFKQFSLKMPYLRFIGLFSFSRRFIIIFISTTYIVHFSWSILIDLGISPYGHMDMNKMYNMSNMLHNMNDRNHMSNMNNMLHNMNDRSNMNNMNNMLHNMNYRNNGII